MNCFEDDVAYFSQDADDRLTCAVYYVRSSGLLINQN